MKHKELIVFCFSIVFVDSLVMAYSISSKTRKDVDQVKPFHYGGTLTRPIESENGIIKIMLKNLKRKSCIWYEVKYCAFQMKKTWKVYIV